MIEEIPVETMINEQEKENTQESPIEEEIVHPAPKKKGRPKGSLGKKKKDAPAPEEIQTIHKKTISKPKAKKPRPPSPESSSSEEPLPRKPRKSRVRAEPQEEQVVYAAPDNRQIAAEVLHMLSSRHLDMRQAKRDKYRSWFQ